MRRRLKVVGGAVCGLLLGLCVPHCAWGQVLPNDRGKAEFVHNCTACHRADMVVAVKKTPDEWRKSVDEMAARGTDGTKEDLDNVVWYLDKYYSTDKPAAGEATAPTPTPASAADHAEGDHAVAGHADVSHGAAPGASEIEAAKRVVAENGCLGCHRIEQQGAYTAPSLNGLGTRRTAEEIRAAIVHHHAAPGFGSAGAAPAYEQKIAGEDLDNLVHYLDSLPALP